MSADYTVSCKRMKMIESVHFLINQYNQYKLQAHSVFMHGQEKEASQLYNLAFEANQNIIKEDTSIESINRTLEICLDCLDFCICNEGTNSAYYLNTTGDIFSSIIEGAYSNNVKQDALIAYSEISLIAKITEHCRGSSEYLQSQFNNLCYKNKDLLKNL